MRTHDIKLKDGTVIKLRLTSRALNDFLEEVNATDAPPIAGVMQAVNSYPQKMKLFTYALDFPGAPADRPLSGDDLVDLLIDDGRTAEYLDDLVIVLAKDCGLLDADSAKQMRGAVSAYNTNMAKTMLRVLTNTAEVIDEYTTEPESEPEENPT